MQERTGGEESYSVFTPALLNRLRCIIVQLVFALCLFALNFPALGQITETWTGNGNDSLWTSSNNWSPPGVPGPNDTAIINLPGSNLVILNTNLVGSIDLGGQGTNILELTGGSIQCSGSILISNNGILEITSGSAVSGGSLQNSGTIMVPANLGEFAFTNIACDFTNYGIIDVESNSTLDLSSSGLTGNIDFESGTVFAGTGTVRMTQLITEGASCNGSMVLNGTLILETDLAGSSSWSGPGSLQWHSGSLGAPVFAPGFHVELSGPDEKALIDNSTNQGTITWFGGGPLIMVSSTASNVGLFNSGTILLEASSSLSVGPPSGTAFFQNSGTIEVPPGLGELALTTDCNLTNYGTIDAETNSTLDFVTDYATFDMFESGTLFSGPGTVRFLSTSQGPVSWSGNITVNTTLDMGAYVGSGTPSVWNGSGVLLMRGGLVNFTISPGFNVQLYSSGIDGICTNQGTLRILATTTGGFGDPFNGFQFYNSGLLQIETNCQFGSGANFHNTGTIKIPANLGELFLTNYYCNFTNYGTIDAETNSILDIVPSFGTADFESGTLFSGPGTVRLPLSNGGPAYWTGNITVDGTLDMGAFTDAGAGTYSVWNGPGLLQLRGGLVNFTFSPGFNVQIYSSGLNGICTNLGNIRYLATFGPIGDSFDTFQFYNEGLFQIETNLNWQYGGFQNTGTITVPANFPELSFTVGGGLTNFGTIDVEANSVLDILANENVASYALFESGSTFSGPGTDRLTGMIDCEGTMNVSGTVEFNNFDGINPGITTWTGSGLFRWTGGQLNTVTFAPGFNAEFTGPDQKYLTQVCTNQGTVRWLGGGQLNDPFTSGQFFNAGLVQIETDGTWNNTPVKNEPSGTFRQLAGQFSVQSITNCGTVDLRSGTLNVASNFVSGSNSTYQLTLSGTTPGTNFNQLTAQNLSLNGALQVAFSNGFAPANGSSFTIAIDSSQSGTFASLTPSLLQSSLALNVAYSPTTVILDVAPAFLSLTNSIYTNGSFQFSLSGNPAGSYDIQSSSNLTDWTTIGTNSPFTGSVNFTDTNTASPGHRFYRARIFP